MGWGGSRPGAGRKPGVPDAYYTEVLDTRVKPRFAEVVERLLRLALDEDTSDKVRLSACVYIIDRVLGKPPQAIVEPETARELVVRVLKSDGANV